MKSFVPVLVLGLAMKLVQTQVSQSPAPGGSSVAPGQQCTYSWAASANTNYAGGTANNAANVGDCQAACINLQSCIAIDFNPTGGAGGQCFTLNNLNGQKFTGGNSGITHYDLIRTCTQSCTPSWTALLNTNYAGGVANAATTVAACQAACLASSGCLAIDFNPNGGTGQLCWLLNSLNGQRFSGGNSGITHYDLVQNCPVQYYAYVNPRSGALYVDPNSNLKFINDFNKMTLFTASACLAQSISTFNNTPNCFSIAPTNPTNYFVYTTKMAAQSQASVATDRYREDASLIEVPNAFLPGYFGLQPSAAFGTTFYLRSSSSDSSLILVPAVTDSNAASFYKISVFVSSQPVTGTCPNVWSRVSGAKKNVMGSFNARSVNDCYARCLLYPNCSGVSYSSNQCYLDTNVSAPLVQDDDYLYYDLSQTSPYQCSRGCIYTFSPQTGANYTSLSTTSTISPPYSCRQQCIQDTTCVGFNVVNAALNIGCTLYRQIAGQSIVTADFIVMARSFVNCGCDPITFYNFNTSDINATQATGVSGFSNCFTACINRRGCTGFDLRNAGGDCWLSSTDNLSKNLTTATGNVHVEIQRPQCGNGCQDKWDHFANTNMSGNTPFNGASTEQACRQACQANSTCTAISWNTATNSCFLATSSSLRNLEGTAPGWNTYNLYRLAFCDN